MRVVTPGNGAAPLALLNIKAPKNACPTDRSGGAIAWFMLAMKVQRMFSSMIYRYATTGVEYLRKCSAAEFAHSIKNNKNSMGKITIMLSA